MKDIKNKVDENMMSEPNKVPMRNTKERFSTSHRNPSYWRAYLNMVNFVDKSIGKPFRSIYQEVNIRWKNKFNNSMSIKKHFMKMFKKQYAHTYYYVDNDGNIQKNN